MTAIKPLVFSHNLFTYYALYLACNDILFIFQLMYSGNSHSSSANSSENSNGRHHPHHQSLSNLHHTNQSNNSAAAAANDENTVMSMKKSAEIAAVFSGAKINQRTDIADHNLSTEQDDFVEVDRYRQQFSESNMHSSLGYFP